MSDTEPGIDLNDETTASCCDDTPLWSAPFGRRLLELVDYRKGITALDIGSGTGFPMLELAMRLGPSCTVYGVDPWSAAANRARLKAAHCGITNISLVEGAAENLPLGDASVDLIVSNNGLNNVPDLPAVLRECARVARPGCQFVMTMNLDGTMVEFYDVYRESLRAHGMAEYLPAIDAHIRAKRPPIALIERLFGENRFARKRSIAEGFDYRFADGTAMLNHFFIRLAFLDGWKSCIPAGERQRIFADIESRINAKSADGKGFALTVPFVAMEFVKE